MFLDETPCRQMLPSWFTLETIHLLKNLETQIKLLNTRPTAYPKQKVRMLNAFVDSSEHDLIDYQTKLAETRVSFVVQTFQADK